MARARRLDSYEIAVEFRRLEHRTVWDIVEDWVWLGKLIKLRQWAAYGRWRKKTTWGKRWNREWIQRKRARLKSIVVGYGKCEICGRLFERTAADAEPGRRAHRKTCGRGCWNKKGNAARGNLITMDGVAKTRDEWARKYGLKKCTLSYRLSRGMSIREALGAAMDGRTQLITIGGASKTRAQWARQFGLKPATICHRLKRGMSLQEALQTPPRRARLITMNGVSKTQKEWAALYGLDRSCVSYRLRQGMGIREALETPLDPRSRRTGRKRMTRNAGCRAASRECAR